MKAKNLLFFSFILIFLSCENLFDYSVYNADVKEAYKETTKKNLDKIEQLQSSTSNFKFAVITDTHYFYDNLKKVINKINEDDEILFVIVTGDITEQGVLKEFEIFYDILQSLEKPYLTVIGNHEYLSNGGLIYNRMFGDFNYTLNFNNNKFIFFDNVVWESNKTPDFNWLSNQLNNSSLFNQTFVFAHIPPTDSQLNDEMKQTYYSILEQNNVELSVHGHAHNYSLRNRNNVSYLTVPSINKNQYCVVNVDNQSFTVETKTF